MRGGPAIAASWGRWEDLAIVIVNSYTLLDRYAEVMQDAQTVNPQVNDKNAGA